MSRYEIIPTRLRHIRNLAATMRPLDRSEIELAGLVPRHALVDLWQRSTDPMTALVDGDIAAIWGDAAPVLARSGSMWLFTAPPIERVPLAYFREARREIHRRLMARERLEADVLASYAQAIRFFTLLGFSIGPEFPGPCGQLYRRMVLRRHPETNSVH